MKKIPALILLLLTAMRPTAKADEGMWLLTLIRSLNIDTMQALGCNLSAEDIYSINQGSLKDAIVIFDNGCTAELVSEDGLLLTNHHCGFDAIQSHSTVEHNYLEDGFWAMEREEELPNPGLRVTFLKRIEDVTGIILNRLTDEMDEDARNGIIEAVADSLVNGVQDGSHYEASVESFFGGNQYFLFVYEHYNDVRLVGAPPSSIGKFGYDTDNWIWPRHTGDFSIFRIYGDADGNPAYYDDDNVPLKPDHFLPVSLNGYEKGDFAMVLGYPGGTDRYMTSYEVNELLQITNPNRVEIRGLKQDIMLKDMLADEEVFIQYADKYSTSSNYWKYSIGQNEGLRRLNVMEDKKHQEAAFTAWVDSDESRRAKYGNALDLIRQSVEQRASYEYALQYAEECFFSGSEILYFAYESLVLYYNMVREPGNHALIDSLAAELKEAGDEFFKNYHLSTDMKITPALMELFFENVPADFHPEFFREARKGAGMDFDRYCSSMFNKTLFADQEGFQQFIEHPSATALERDPAFQAAQSALNLYSDLFYTLQYFDRDYERGHRLYVAGLMEMNPEKTFYPDANFTMRMTYGTVNDYFPRDAVHYDYQTTLAGVMEKEDPDNWEFAVPDKLKELYRSKDFGPYGEDGVMPVCFITNNDITGGNSGSPVINGNGNLIGLAFDGNWEAMSGDIIYEDDLQRCICVDIRYVLLIIDKYAGASHLIDEMKLVQ